MRIYIGMLDRDVAEMHSSRSARRRIYLRLLADEPRAREVEVNLHVVVRPDPHTLLRLRERAGGISVRCVRAYSAAEGSRRG